MSFVIDKKTTLAGEKTSTQLNAALQLLYKARIINIINIYINSGNKYEIIYVQQWYTMALSKYTTYRVTVKFSDISLTVEALVCMLSAAHIIAWCITIVLFAVAIQ